LEPRIVVNLPEFDGFMEVVRSGGCHTPPKGIEPIGAKISARCSGWKRNVAFVIFGYEEALQLDSRMDSWIVLAWNAVLGAHSLVLEDGSELPKVPSIYLVSPQLGGWLHRKSSPKAGWACSLILQPPRPY
jgi:hypothetical protein